MIEKLEQLIFGNRAAIIGVFAIVTVFMGYVAVTQLKIDAGLDKLLPLEHEYMKTYVEYRDQFSGANRILVALIAKDGDMFTPEFFDALKNATDAVFFIPGVDRSRVQSLFTPNVRFTEVVAGGIEAGNVVPADFQPTPEGLAQVRDNILKAGIVGRLVANDFSGAIISAQLLEVNPETQQPLDVIHVANLLEENVRDVFESEDVGVHLGVHIIGFSKVIGDISDGARVVILFFGIALVITALLVYLYSQSWRVTIVPLFTSIVAVIWQLGSFSLLGYGIDPLGILVPFLIFAIGVSHGVQIISAIGSECYKGAGANEACRASFRRLAVPGTLALASDTIGFITILLIDIRVIQEMAITASLGVAAIILTNLVLLPVLLCDAPIDDVYRAKLRVRFAALAPIWARVSRVATRGPATVIMLIAVGLLAVGLWLGPQVKIGDLHAGVPELRAESRYNQDTRLITDKFSIGVDVIQAIAEVPVDGCIDYEVMTTLDDFTWHMRNVEGVQGAISVPTIAKVINAGWNEGSLKWRVLPRTEVVMVQNVRPIETSTGLRNDECSVMPLVIFTTDHKAETIDRIVAAVKDFRDDLDSDKVNIRLATGNVGVMAASNEVVEAAQFPILIGVFSAIILLCWLTFRSLRAVLCIVIPLALVSLLAYALMAVLEIGLKVSTLPVVALGVGIGVDYGIYIFSRLQGYLKTGMPLAQAYERSLTIAGNAVVFTGITLAIGVATWIFSPLKFQADMGILLTFMFLVNMLGAIFLLPALAYWLMPEMRADRHETSEIVTRTA